ncbi:DUF6484 domain-containing protein [Sphaerotilus microaerophilus]|uniref:DUF6484 domain-containing protein n=1 Tax=Sphaerotilus microaerophilus TaxID=2914710 RepID=A0ABN6PIQ8_9BURK|nr:DUF6484 domain-containing protein [Sphaerotilus sp. FB-5]BDI04853.1 hypothetical protein CATMQ487_18230 [Sphaerotilus sp. FB-5]
MKPNEVPVELLTTDPSPAASAFERLQQQPTTLQAKAMLAPAIGRLHGFDLLDQPVVAALPATPGGLLPARTTVPLRRTMLGREVLVIFENADAGKPVIVGVIEPNALLDEPAAKPMPASVQADGERQVIEAEREIVLKCGDASITLTCAGKVIIRGNYILSRSTGYNKIKGAAIDIN